MRNQSVLRTLIVVSMLGSPLRALAEDSDYSEDKDTVKELQNEDGAKNKKLAPDTPDPAPKEEKAEAEQPSVQELPAEDAAKEEAKAAEAKTPDAGFDGKSEAKIATPFASPENHSPMRAEGEVDETETAPGKTVTDFQKHQDTVDPDAKISDGTTAITLPDNTLSIVPPKNWLVLPQKGPGAAFQIPTKPGLRYRATIQVNSFDGAKFIDSITVSQFKEELTRKYSALSGVRQFQVSTSSEIQLEDGTKAILYYADFMLGETQMMQMHVLLSSQTNHFLVTYTDLAEEFTKQDEASNLRQAYTSVTSAKPSTRVQSRLSLFTWIGIMLAGIIVTGFAYRILSMKRIRRMAEEADREAMTGMEEEEAEANNPTTQDDALEFASSSKAISMKPIKVEQEEDWDIPKKKKAKAESEAEAVLSSPEEKEEEEKWQNLEKNAEISSENEEKEQWSNLKKKAVALNKEDDDGEAVDEEVDKAV